jgi:hypothetical protein
MAQRRTPFTLNIMSEGGYPIWGWLAHHHPIDHAAVKSLENDMDSFITCFKTKFTAGCFCLKPTCVGCARSGQDALLFIHRLSEFLLCNPDAPVGLALSTTDPAHEQNLPQFVLIRKLVAFSTECRVRHLGCGSSQHAK